MPSLVVANPAALSTLTVSVTVSRMSYSDPACGWSAGRTGSLYKTRIDGCGMVRLGPDPAANVPTVRSLSSLAGGAGSGSEESTLAGKTVPGEKPHEPHNRLRTMGVSRAASLDQRGGALGGPLQLGEDERLE